MIDTGFDGVKAVDYGQVSKDFLRPGAVFLMPQEYYLTANPVFTDASVVSLPADLDPYLILIKEKTHEAVIPYGFFRVRVQKGTLYTLVNLRDIAGHPSSSAFRGDVYAQIIGREQKSVAKNGSAARVGFGLAADLTFQWEEVQPDIRVITFQNSPGYLVTLARPEYPLDQGNAMIPIRYGQKATLARIAEALTQAESLLMSQLPQNVLTSANGRGVDLLNLSGGLRIISAGVRE